MDYFSGSSSGAKSRSHESDDDDEVDYEKNTLMPSFLTTRSTI